MDQLNLAWEHASAEDVLCISADENIEGGYLPTHIAVDLDYLALCAGRSDGKVADEPNAITLLEQGNICH
jgi:hypothetical protein